MSEDLTRSIVRNGELFLVVTKAGKAETRFLRVADDKTKTIMLFLACFTQAEAERMIEAWQEGRSHGYSEGEDSALAEVKRALRL